MPNYGRSGRCRTCKQRRVKCDEARPTCSPCRRLHLDCGGYAKDFTFRNENRRFASTAIPKSQQPASPLRPTHSLLTATDVAVPFFLVHYAHMGRRLAAARGFYETLIPAYTSSRTGSPLSLAVFAVAAKILSFWRHENTVQVESHPAPYTLAIASLRSALERPEDRRDPATSLAALTLHLYESISAVYEARQVSPVHHYGALSLLPIVELDGLDDLVATHVQGFVLHAEISSALRQKRSVHPNAHSLMNKLRTSGLGPVNFSSTLDYIGASIAELQANHVVRLLWRHPSRPVPMQQRRACIAETVRLTELLRDWAQEVPNHWRPLKLTKETDFSLSIPAYQSACDVYPSCQIATLWNSWRFHSLLLLKFTMQMTRTWTLSWEEERLMSRTTGYTGGIDAIRGLVDSICYSVPFYLGNRSKQSSVNDFTDRGILFPSYHSLTSGESRTVCEGQRGSSALSKDEHHRHIVAYGAWHIMSPLSNLMTLFAHDEGGGAIACYLRPGQQEWICEQFSRVATLLRLPTVEHPGCKPLHVPGQSFPNAAELLAKQVREGTLFMSGP